MALAIDASTPAIATQTSATTATVASASFTPPAGALLLVRWEANTEASINPFSPSITDSLGSHLGWALLDWQSRADTPNARGQSATWWATVGSSAAMTVTVTTGTTSGNCQAALHITVLTGQHATTPIGAHGKNGSTSASSITQNFTGTASGSWGFLGVCDWDAKGNFTAGTGCTLTSGGTGTIPTTQISYVFVRRTTADGTLGGTTPLRASPASTSTNLTWTYVEVVPAASTTVDGAAALTGAGALAAPVVVQGVTAAPAGAGALTAAVVQGVTAAPTGAGALSAAATLATSATLTGAGTLTAAATLAVPATLTGAGVLAPPVVTQSVTASLAGTGVAAVTVTLEATATLAGTGVVAATVTQGVTSTPTGTGALSSPADQVVTANLAGAGVLAATGEVSGSTANASATLTGAGTLTAAATEDVTATLAGAGSVAALGVLAGEALPVGVGALSAAATVRIDATATLVGAGAVTAGATARTLANRPTVALRTRPESASPNGRPATVSRTHQRGSTDTTPPRRST